MDHKSIGPLDTGQRIRRKRRKHRTSELVRRVLRNRRVLMTVLWVAKAIVQLARLVGQIIGGS